MKNLTNNPMYEIGKSIFSDLAKILNVTLGETGFMYDIEVGKCSILQNVPENIVERVAIIALKERSVFEKHV